MSAEPEPFVPDGRCVGMWDWSAAGIRCTGCGHRFSDICEGRARHSVLLAVGRGGDQVTTVNPDNARLFIGAMAAWCMLAGQGWQGAADDGPCSALSLSIYR